MEFHDPFGVLTPVDVGRFCADHGRPPPEQVRLRGTRSRSAVYELRFSAKGGPPVDLWVELGEGLMGSALARERTALTTLLGRDVELPTLPPLLGAPTQAFGGRWAAFRPPSGSVQALEWIARSPDPWPACVDRLVRTLRALNEVQLPHFGLQVDEGFRSEVPSWRAAWSGWVARLAERIRTGGVELGPLTDRLLEAIETRMPTLDGVSRFTLVHGNLGPQSLELRGGPGGAPHLMVCGWDLACAGDPLVDIAALFGMDAPWSNPVLAGLGPSTLRSYLEPETLSRLELYHFTWCLAQRAVLAADYGFDGEITRLASLAGLARHAREALSPGFVAGRLEQALNTSGPVHSPPFAPRTEPDAALYVALGHLASDHPASWLRAWEVTRGLGAALLARDLTGTDPAAAQVAVRHTLLATRQVRAGPLQGAGPEGAELPGDHPLGPGLALALMLRSMALLAVDALRGEVPTGWRAGLAALEGAALAGPGPQTGPMDQPTPLAQAVWVKSALATFGLDAPVLSASADGLIRAASAGGGGATAPFGPGTLTQLLSEEDPAQRHRLITGQALLRAPRHAGWQGPAALLKRCDP